MRPRYTLEDFDNDGLLKLGFVGWVVIFVLTFDYWMAVGLIFSRSANMLMVVHDDNHLLVRLLVQLPALITLILAVNRKREAGTIQNFLWGHSKIGLVVSASATAFLIWLDISPIEFVDMHVFFNLLKIAGLIGCLLWILYSGRSKDLFKV